jgi:hypothetical protein|tara:strand:+ start:9997 stop:10269 length:273 start_codon:yes stop_codon:yes gene_type:complete
MDTVKASAANATRGLKQFSISDLRPSRVDVVEVREKEMKEMPLGKERALAFDRKHKRSFWSFALPNFEEPTLPNVNEDSIDGSLLPPKPL